MTCTKSDPNKNETLKIIHGHLNWKTASGQTPVYEYIWETLLLSWKTKFTCCKISAPKKHINIYASQHNYSHSIQGTGLLKACTCLTRCLLIKQQNPSLTNCSCGGDNRHSACHPELCDCRMGVWDGTESSDGGSGCDNSSLWLLAPITALHSALRL